MCDATRSTERDFCRLQHIVHHFRFLRLAASTSKLTCRFFSFFWPIRSCPALISCFSSTYTAMPVAESVNFPADKKLFAGTSSARGRGCHVLRVALGDNESLKHASHFNSRDLTKQEKTGTMSFFTSSSKTIKRSSRRRSSRQRTRARYTYVRGQPSDTQARPGTLVTTFFCQ